MDIAKNTRVMWIATVPRTGSMWTFNVLRDLVRSTGQRVLPEIVPSTDAEMEAIGRAGIDADGGVYVVKVHTRIPADLQRSVYVVTHRDLRDSLISFMRFTQSDFDAGVRFVSSALLLEKHFATFPADRTLRVEYEDIISRPDAVVQQLGNALGMAVEPSLCAEVVDRYTKERVRERLVEREKALREKIATQQPVDRREFVAPPDRPLRAFDLSTGFQSGHISAYKEGDWRRILTPRQQTVIGDLIDYANSKERRRS